MTEMNATINLPTVLRQLAGGLRSVPTSGATVGEAFAEVAARFPKLGDQLVASGGSLPVFVNVFVDDEDIRYQEGLDTPLRAGSEITILPAVAGG